MLATSFADAADLRAFNRALLDGKSNREALEVGDNGIGAWGRSTVAGTGPCVALSPHTAGFRPNRMVRVFHGEKFVDCDVRDIGPTERIDLNPDACMELGLYPPVKVMVDWNWL
jgi:hypothetical protein